MSRVALLTLPLHLAAAGCSVVLVPGEVQCDTTADCEARGFEGAACVANVCEKAEVIDPIWGCLGKVDNPLPDKTKKVPLAVSLVFASDQAPVTNAKIDVCDKLDVQCTGMNPDTPKGLKPNSKGLVELEVVQGFDGFVRVTGPEIMDSRVFVGRPIITPPAVKEVRLLRPLDYSTLILYTGEEFDDTRGSSILYAIDCQGLAASGVRFETPSGDAKTKEYYLINQFPTSPPDATTTDVDGFGGFFNMPVGQAVARSILERDDAAIGESSFQVLANTISYVQIAPTPK